MAASVTFYAHSDGTDDKAAWQKLSVHLENVARRCREFADELGYGSWGEMAGLLHDLGKATPEFQRRLEGAGDLVDHSTAGALFAKELYVPLGLLFSYAVAGHHGGIPNGSLDAVHRTCLVRRFKRLESVPASVQGYVADHLEALPQEDFSQLPMAVRDSAIAADPKRRSSAQIFAISMFEWFLHSCLVDADYLDTERYMDPAVSAKRGGYASMLELDQRFEAHMAELARDAADTVLNRARQQILADCLTAAEFQQGLFLLSVPTGGGKTLASVGFAIKHALAHGLERVIIAIPYTSIVEQTAAVLKRVFGEENVLEHHSNYDFDPPETEKGMRERLAVQNWDAPIIVTTNVQLLESIFSNRPGKSRKVHRMARSVIVLDEAQTLPDRLLLASLAALEVLAIGYRSSVVLCTATQPKLEGIWPFGTRPTEIAVHRELFADAFGGRARYRMIGEVALPDLAARLCEHRQALCIVGSRREALDLYEAVVSASADGDCGDHAASESACDHDLGAGAGTGRGIYYLSTFMTPAHRFRALREIRSRLSADARCIVISTQLIEAGVDIDFPVVYRELAGMDSLVQAAGRCNREGTRDKPSSVQVFECLDETGGRYQSTRWLESLKDITRMLIREHDGLIDDSLIGPFFQQRYGAGSDLDAEGIFAELTSSEVLQNSLATLPLARVAEAYRIIEDETQPVFVRWGDEAEQLYRAVRHAENPSALARPVQQHSIGLRPQEIERLRRAGLIEDLDVFHVLTPGDGGRTIYSASTGYRPEGKEELQTLIS